MMPLLLVPTMTRCYLHNCRLHLSSAILPTTPPSPFFFFPPPLSVFLPNSENICYVPDFSFPATSPIPTLLSSPLHIHSPPSTRLSHSPAHIWAIPHFIPQFSLSSSAFVPLHLLPPSLARESSILHPLSCDRPSLPWSQVPECLSPTEAIKSSAQSFLASKSVKQKAEPTYSVYSPQSTKTKPKKQQSPKNCWPETRGWMLQEKGLNWCMWRGGEAWHARLHHEHDLHQL